MAKVPQNDSVGSERFGDSEFISSLAPNESWVISFSATRFVQGTDKIRRLAHIQLDGFLKPHGKYEEQPPHFI